MLCALFLILPTLMFLTEIDYSSAETEVVIDDVIYTELTPDTASARIDPSTTLTEIHILDNVIINSAPHTVTAMENISQPDNNTVTTVVINCLSTEFIPTGPEFENLKALESFTVNGSSTTLKANNGSLYNYSRTTLIHIPNTLRTGDFEIIRWVVNFPTYCSYPNITAFTPSAAGNAVSIKSGVIYSSDETKLIAYPGGNTNTTYTVLATATSVGDHAFSDCSHLETLVLSDGITTLPPEALKGTNLKSIHFGSGYTGAPVDLDVTDEISINFNPGALAGSTMTFETVDTSSLSDDVKTKLGTEKVYRINTTSAVDTTVTFDSALFKTNYKLYSISATSELTEILTSPGTNPGELTATVSANTMFAVFDGSDPVPPGPAPPGPTPPAPSTDEPVLTDEEGIIISAAVVGSTAVISGAYIALGAKGQQGVMSLLNGNVLDVLRYRTKDTRRSDFRISIWVVLLLTLLPVIESLLLYLDTQGFDIFPSSFAIDDSLWISYGILFESLFAGILIYYSYTRMEYHSASDIGWRGSIIKSLESSGENIDSLKDIDERMKASETFRSRPLKILLSICLLSVCLLALMFYQISLTGKPSLELICMVPWLTFIPVAIAAIMLTLAYSKLITFLHFHEMAQQEFVINLIMHTGFADVPQLRISRRGFSWPIHAILVAVTLGIYAVFNIFWSLHATNRHIAKQDECTEKLSSYGLSPEERQKRMLSSKMPAMLVLMEFVLIYLCSKYILDLFGYGQDLFNLFTENGGDFVMDMEFVLTALLIVINVMFLKAAFESVLNLPRRTPSSKYGLLDTCFKFILSQILSMVLVYNSDSINQIFSFNLYLSIAVCTVLIAWILLSKKVYRYYKCGETDSDYQNLLGYYKGKIQDTARNSFKGKD